MFRFVGPPGGAERPFSGGSELVIHRRPALPDGLAEGGDRLVPGVRLVAGQILQAVKIGDQGGIVVALPHVPDHLGRLQLRDDALQGGEAGEELLPLRLRPGAELPKYDMSDHAIFSFR